MPIDTQHKNIYIADSTYGRLKKRRHPGQSFDGVIIELLDLYDNANNVKEAIKVPSESSTTS